MNKEITPMSIAFASADRILQEIRAQQCTQEGGSPIDEIDTDCHRLRMAIVHRTLRGELTSVEDVILLDQELGIERRKEIAAQLEKSRRCNAKSDNLKLFRVENRAGRSIKVAAVDTECARMFAFCNGHVQEAKNAKVFVYKDEWIERQKQAGSAVWRALKEGVPGVLKEVGNHVIIESRNRVYTPLSPVIAPNPRFAKE